LIINDKHNSILLSQKKANKKLQTVPMHIKSVESVSL